MRGDVGAGGGEAIAHASDQNPKATCWPLTGPATSKFDIETPSNRTGLRSGNTLATRLRAISTSSARLATGRASVRLRVINSKSAYLIFTVVVRPLIPDRLRQPQTSSTRRSRAAWTAASSV